MSHTETDILLSYKTWSDRGWCRLERLARAVGHSTGFVTLLPLADLALYDPPGKGTFTVEDDKQKKIAPVTNCSVS